MVPPAAGFTPVTVVVSVVGVLAVPGCKVVVPTKLVVLVAPVVAVWIVATPVWTPPAGPATAPTMLAVMVGEIALL